MPRAPLILCFVLAVAGAGSAVALDEPVVWRDDESGCAYFLTPSGGITPRLRRDGTPDCPNAREPGSALVDKRSTTERKSPRRSRRRVRAEKKASTALIHEAEVGVK